MNILTVSPGTKVSPAPRPKSAQADASDCAATSFNKMLSDTKARIARKDADAQPQQEPCCNDNADVKDTPRKDVSHADKQQSAMQETKAQPDEALPDQNASATAAAVLTGMLSGEPSAQVAFAEASPTVSFSGATPQSISAPVPLAAQPAQATEQIAAPEESLPQTQTATPIPASPLQSATMDQAPVVQTAAENAEPQLMQEATPPVTTDQPKAEAPKPAETPETEIPPPQTTPQSMTAQQTESKPQSKASSQKQTAAPLVDNAQAAPADNAQQTEEVVSAHEAPTILAADKPGKETAQTVNAAAAGTVQHTAPVTQLHEKTEVASVTRQITQQIEQQVQAGKPEFTMQLFPQNLGKITVKLGIQNNTLVVELTAESSKTQSLLSTQASTIREILQGQVNPHTQVTVADETHPQQPWNQQQDSARRDPRDSQQQQQPHREQTTDDFLKLMQMMNAG